MLYSVEAVGDTTVLENPVEGGISLTKEEVEISKTIVCPDLREFTGSHARGARAAM